MLTPQQLVTYLREPGLSATDEAVIDLVETTNGLVQAVVGYPWPEHPRVHAIALEVAARAFTNPRGYESGNERIDDYSTGWRLPGAKAGAHLTDAETRELLAIVAGVLPLDPVPFSGSLPYRRSW